MEGYRMKKAAMWLLLLLTLVLFAPDPVLSQDKPLGPGWLSLDGSVGLLDKSIADGKGSLEKALGINISGFFDTSYTYSSNRPGRASGNDISGRYFDQDHNDVVFNYFNLTLEKPEKDWGVGFKLVGDFGRGGELLREATFWGPTLRREPSAELREAFLTTTIPVGEGIGIKGGLFVTPLGTEILPSPGAYNDNISRSFLFNMAVPLRHLGVLFSYPVHKILTVTAGPVTGWDNPHDTNSQPSFLGGITLTPAEVFTLATNVIAGPEQPRNNGNTRVAISNVATIKVIDPLTVFLEYTWGNEGSLGGHWQGGAAIASYNWTDRFNTALRGELFYDHGGSRNGVNATALPNLHLYELTLTGAYKFTSKFIGRAEVRQDWADENYFTRRNTAVDRAQTTFAFQLIYGF